jgi:fatty acid desaturase
MNHFIPWILGPFYGETPETYFSHHIIMHHAENNLINDLSCTLNYQRDRFIDFIKYFLIFFVLGMVDLTYYLKRKNRWKFIRKVVLGEIGFFIICGILWQFNWAATLTVFVLPFFIARFGMMAGNWAQHGFIGTDPASPYTNSITCINCTYNRTCFNDGYHIGHHLRPNMHWTDMPAELSNNIERYKSNGAIVFQGIDFFVIWFLLMTKNYRKLSKHYVDIRQEFTTQEEIIAMLKERVKRFNMKRIHPNANVIFNSIC